MSNLPQKNSNEKSSTALLKGGHEDLKELYPKAVAWLKKQQMGGVYIKAIRRVAVFYGLEISEDRLDQLVVGMAHKRLNENQVLAATRHILDDFDFPEKVSYNRKLQANHFKEAFQQQGYNPRG